MSAIPETLTLPSPVLFILHTISRAGFEVYLVGGAVRDLLSGAQEVVDFDFTTNARPEEIQALFPEHFYENQFGTVGVAESHLFEQMGQKTHEHAPEKDKELYKNKLIDLTSATKIHTSLQETGTLSEKDQLLSEQVYEITTFRSDGVYSDFRKPEAVTWGNNLEEDLSRRDFTINAMALSVDPQLLAQFDFASAAYNNVIATSYCTIYDPHNGKIDLDREVIITVGDPNQRFQEDALRMLRAIRFSVQLNMKIDQPTYQAITTNANLIQHISFERIRDEFLKMLLSNYPKEAVLLLDKTGLLQHIIPELAEGKGVLQAGHHTTDVWTHNLDALDCCPSKDPIVRLATLLHDIAKPATHKYSNGLPTFYNHEIVGSRMAKKIAQRLRLSKKDIDRIFILVRQHMFYYQPENTDASIRRFMRNVGLQNINDILDLREADRLGSGARETSWRLEEMKERMVAQLHQPFSITDLAINGHDIMKHLHIQPGPKIGKILTALFEEVLENPELNKRDLLLEKTTVLRDQL